MLKPPVCNAGYCPAANIAIFSRNAAGIRAPGGFSPSVVWALASLQQSAQHTHQVAVIAQSTGGYLTVRREMVDYFWQHLRQPACCRVRAQAQLRGNLAEGAFAQRIASLIWPGLTC